MTWFYNDEGVAHGPLDEIGMMSLISAGKVHAKTLIWQASMELWQEVGTLNPSWWQPAVEKPNKATTPVTTDISSTRRSPVPLAPTQEPKKTKAVGLLRRFFGGKDQSE